MHCFAVFNLFNVVTFRNEPCSSTTAVYDEKIFFFAFFAFEKNKIHILYTFTNWIACVVSVFCRFRAGVVRNGTCFTAQECMDRVGQSAGNCASGWKRN